MKRKLTAAAAAFAMLTVAMPLAPVMEPTLPVFAADSEGTLTAGVLTYKILGNYIEITGCDAAADVVEIPAEIDGLPVQSIGGSAFYRCAVTSVVIPDTVTSIGGGAFWHCKTLTSLTIPDSVTTIGSYAFADCAAMERFEIPASVTSIGASAFQDTPWLAAMQAENPFVTVNGILIDASVAVDTSSIEGEIDPVENPLEIVIPDGVTTIGENVFGKKASLVTSVVMPDSVTVIAKQAFFNCRLLTDITFPPLIEEVGESAFDGTAWLTAKREEGDLIIVNDTLIDGKSASGDVVIPEGVTRISGSAFWVNKNITSIQFPEGLTYIGDSAFHSCELLTELTIPAGVTYIGDEAFNGCGLTSLDVPLSVEYIGAKAFVNCSALTGVTIRNKNTQIGEQAFGWSSIFTSTGQYAYIFVETANPDFRFICMDGSTAQQYAGMDSMQTALFLPGDLNDDGVINALDAADILVDAALVASGGESAFTDVQSVAADYTFDGVNDANDAAEVLCYTTLVGCGGENQGA